MKNPSLKLKKRSITLRRLNVQLNPGPRQRLRKMPAKVKPAEFPLTNSSRRIALLTGVLAGTVGSRELKHHIALDAEPRPYKKPVVAWGKRYESISAAAAAAHTRFRWTGQDRTEAAWQKYIARLCNADCWAGFYWSE